MFSIRRAQLCDLSSIKELAAITVPQAFEGTLTTEQIDYLEDLNYSQANLSRAFAQGQVYFIASAGSSDCGYASLIQEGPDLFHLPKIYVVSTMQRRGIGSALLDSVVRYVKDLHPEPCALEVNVNRYNSALNFYLKRGFTKVRERGIAFENGFELTQDVLQRVI